MHFLYTFGSSRKQKHIGGSRAAAATSKMERFVIIVNSWRPLTIITKRSVLDVTAALDPSLEAEAFGSRRLKLQSIDGFFESKKVKGSNIVKCAQKKHFSYIIDKIVLLRRNFSKALAILSWFSLLLFLLFLLIVYISFAFHLQFFQS